MKDRNDESNKMHSECRNIPVVSGNDCEAFY